MAGTTPSAGFSRRKTHSGGPSSGNHLPCDLHSPHLMSAPKSILSATGSMNNSSDGDGLVVVGAHGQSPHNSRLLPSLTRISVSSCLGSGIWCDGGPLPVKMAASEGLLVWRVAASDELGLPLPFGRSPEEEERGLQPLPLIHLKFTRLTQSPSSLV